MCTCVCVCVGGGSVLMQILDEDDIFTEVNIEATYLQSVPSCK